MDAQDRASRACNDAHEWQELKAEREAKRKAKIVCTSGWKVKIVNGIRYQTGRVVVEEGKAGEL